MMKYSSFLLSLVWWLKKAVLSDVLHKAETTERKDDSRLPMKIKNRTGVRLP